MLIRPVGEAGYNSLNVIMPMNVGNSAPATVSKSGASGETTETATETAAEEEQPVAVAA